MDHVQAGELNGFWYPTRFIAQFAPRRGGKWQTDGHGQKFSAVCARKEHLSLCLHFTSLVRDALCISVASMWSVLRGGAIRFSVSPKVEAETKRPREGLKPPSRRASSFLAPKELCCCRRCDFRHRVSEFQSIR